MTHIMKNGPADELLSSIRDHTSVLYASLDTDFNYIMVNRAYADACGKDASFFLHQNRFVLYPNDDVRRVFREVVETGKPHYVYAASSIFPDQPGVARYWDIELIPIMDKAGKTYALVETVINVTDRVKANEVVHQSDRKYRMLFENSPFGLGIGTVDGRVVTANQVIRKMLGYDGDDIFTVSIGNFYADPGERSRMMDIYQMRGMVSDYETTLKRRDGTLFPVRMNIIPVDLPAEKGVLVIIADLSDRRKYEQNLIDKNLLEMTINAVEDLIILINPQLRIIAVNDAVLKLMNVPREEVVGKTHAELFSPEIGVYRMAMHRKAIDTKHMVLFEDMRNGHNFEHRVYPVLSAKREVDYLVSYVRDITETRSAEKRLVEALEKERRKIGDILHDSIGQQLSGMAYYLQGTIRQMRELSGENRNRLGYVVEQLSSLIEETRTLARGLDPVNLDDGDFMDLLADLSEKARKIYHVECDVAMDDGIHISDRGVMTGLYYITQEGINNAVRHATPSRIEIRFRRYGDRTVFSIENDGVCSGGIDSKDGMGIRVMKYRAEIIGGALELKKSGDRFTLSVVFR